MNNSYQRPTIESSALVREFANLEDFKSKLKFWDEHGLDFKASKIFFSEINDYISIVPVNDEDLYLHTKWVINHWRKHFLNKTITVKPNYQVKIRSFEELQMQFEARIKKDSIIDVTDLIDKEVAFIEEQALKITANNQLYNKIITYFDRHCEEELFELFKFKSTHSLLEHRTLGKLWEYMRYKAHLQQYKIKMQKLTSKSSDKIGSQLEFKSLTEDQVLKIHNYLVGKKLMKPDLPSFTAIVMERPYEGLSQLVWIERSDKNKPSKMALFALIDGLLTAPPQNNGDYNRWIFKYFTGEDWTTDREKQINRLRSSFTLYNGSSGDRTTSSQLSDFLMEITKIPCI
jgi:hypothetical protein